MLNEPQKATNGIIFVLPTIILGAIFHTFDLIPIYVATPVALAMFMGMQLVSYLREPSLTANGGRLS